MLALDRDDVRSATELIRLGYNDSGDSTEVINSSGRPQRYDYDVDGRVVAWVDRNDTSYGYTYDDNGRCVATTGTGGTLAGQLRYDVDIRTGRQVTTLTDSLGHSTVYQINAQVQVESITDPLGHTTHTTWDRYDRQTVADGSAGP